jgi:RNA recognition motif-containing protein
MNIFVGNLSFQTTEDQLQHTFAEFGAVKTVKVVIDKYTNRSRGFAFVEMEDAAAQQAIEKLNGSYLDRNVIVVNEARPRTEERRDSYSGRSFNKRY